MRFDCGLLLVELVINGSKKSILRCEYSSSALIGVER